VIVPFSIGCGHCFFCSMGMHPHCENTNPEHYGPQGDLMDHKGGGLYGYTDLYGGYAGGQAEYVRVAYADENLRKAPELPDEKVLFLTDIFPTGWAAIDWAEPQGGETIAIFGSGPVGLMAQKAAWLRGASRVIAVDPLQYRLDLAKKINYVETILFDDDTVDRLREMTAGRGPDICVDAVGTEAERSFTEKIKAVVNFEKGSPKVMENCFKAVRRGGKVTVVGVYGSTYDNFPIHRIFDKGLMLRFGQCTVQKYIDQLIDLVEQEKVVLNDIITHQLPLSEATRGYDIFKNKKENCTKVVLTPWN
jgi:S-(hydroxymethyl)glutathione dehydrogenase/alcohol dehydrogenase